MNFNQPVFTIRRVKTDGGFSLLGNLAIGILLLLVACFISCQKEPVARSTKTQVTDTTKSTTGFIDTGTKTLGATLVNAMIADTIVNASFKPTNGPIVLSNAHDTVINGIAADHILLVNCYNITIKNCRIGPDKQPGISLGGCTNIHIDSCYIYHVSTGVFANDSKSISVTQCQAKNMIGPFPKGQFVQFNNISGGGNKVSFNKFENILGQSYTEDAISMYNCNGLPADPIVIESNWIKGGGPSLSGGGIMLGDGGGSNIVARNNFLVNPGQYGMAVSGGSYMSIINNTIYAKAQSFTNEGVYYRNYTTLPSANICIAKNSVNYINANNVVNDTYLGPGAIAPIGWTTNTYNPGLNENILPENIVSGLIFPPSNSNVTQYKPSKGL